MVTDSDGTVGKEIMQMRTANGRKIKGSPRPRGCTAKISNFG
jgi:hypothetical protein